MPGVNWLAGCACCAGSGPGAYGFRHRIGYCSGAGGPFDPTSRPLAGCTVTLHNNATGLDEYGNFVTASDGLTPVAYFSGASTSYTITVVEPSYATDRLRPGPGGASRSVTFTVSAYNAAAAATPAVLDLPLIARRTTAGVASTQLYELCCFGACPTPNPWDLSRPLLFTFGPLACDLAWGFDADGTWRARGTGTVSMTAFGANPGDGLATRDVPVAVVYGCGHLGVSFPVACSAGNPAETMGPAPCEADAYGTAYTAAGHATLSASPSYSGVIYGPVADACMTATCQDGGPPTYSGSLKLAMQDGSMCGPAWGYGPWVRPSDNPWGHSAPFVLSQG